MLDILEIEAETIREIFNDFHQECAFCGSLANDFDTYLAAREFELTGKCQLCQEEVAEEV
jgi:hypothetical protein